MAQRVPGGAASISRMILLVEPTASARSTTSIMHSGWTMILMPGYFARICVTCCGRNIWWTLQQPFQRITRLRRMSSGVLPPSGLGRIPQRHLLQRNAHRPGRVPAQVLIGEEQHAAAPGERPIERGPGVGRRADDAAVPAAKRLQAGRRIDVGDRHQVVGVDHLGQLPPAVFDLRDVGHVGQRAAGGQVGQDHRHAPPAALGKPLGPIGQNVGRFGHEVDAAEGDGPALLVLGRQFGQLVAVAAEVGQRDHVVLLIMMAENQQPRAHFAPHPLDALGEHVVLQRFVSGQIESRHGGWVVRLYTPRYNSMAIFCLSNLATLLSRCERMAMFSGACTRTAMSMGL